MKSNPPWADKALSSIYDRLSDHVDSKWLPVPVGKKKFKEFGCGHYGCVYPTSTPGIVCKITSDVSEAAFVAAYHKIGKKPEGIVTYYDVLKIAGASHRKRPVFVLWREEVQPVTFHAFMVGNSSYTEVENALVGAKIVAHNARIALLGIKDANKRIARAQEALKRMDDVAGWDGIGNSVYVGSRIRSFRSTAEYTDSYRKRMPKDRFLAWAFYMFSQFTDNLDMSFGISAGTALRFYFDKGLLLADVHTANVSLALPDPDYPNDKNWVISDPGHAVALTHDFDNLVIAEI